MLSLYDQYWDALREATDIYPELGQGRNRMAFDLGTGFVLKVPLSKDGEDDNLIEEALYKNDSEGIYAACKVVKFHGVYALEMEKVKPVYLAIDSSDRPHWVDFIDCGQVGYTPDGRLVAYDFA